uniref:Uncharacterized protein n=1 Tax=Trifolium pratense TaxID=57577 RepID=A0A2K3JSZ4_TRIPR
MVVYFESPLPTESKSLCKPKRRTPSDIVRNTSDLLRLLQNSPDNNKRDNDKLIELFTNLRELKTIMYGNNFEVNYSIVVEVVFKYALHLFYPFHMCLKRFSYYPQVIYRRVPAIKG